MRRRTLKFNLSNQLLYLLIGVICTSSLFAQKSLKDLPKIVRKDLEPLVKSVASESLLTLGDGIVMDMNRDGVSDIALIVELAKPSPAGIIDLKSYDKTLKIEYLCGTPVNCCDEVDFSNPALLIIHGKNKSWNGKEIRNFKYSNAVLLRGRGNVHAFQKQNPDAASSFKYFKDRNSIGLEFSTEASEGLLQFRRGKYVWTETEP